MLPEVLSDALQHEADPALERARARELGTVRGCRGVRDGHIARVVAQVWETDRPALPRDRRALQTLFATAYEDGLAAIALAAALLPSDPEAVMELATDWLELVDDTGTADALGTFLLGPALLATGASWEDFATGARAMEHEMPRRAAVMAGLSALPLELQGAPAAALRAALGQDHVQIVGEVQESALVALLGAFVRDEAPPVRKAVRRVAGAWAQVDPDGALSWARDFRGGLPKMIMDEVVAQAERTLKRARRKAAPPA